MKKVVFASLAMAFGMASTTAQAQSTEEGAAGFRVEALAGWDRIDLSIDEANDIEDNDSGIFYGIGIGYDLPSGPVLVGVEAELSSSTNGVEEQVSGLEIDGSVLDGTLSVEDGLNWYVGGRLGTWVSESTAFYGKVGYARTTIDIDAEGTVDGVPASDSADLDFGGWRFGVGVEQRFGTSAFGKLEYRYTSYSDAEVEYDGTSVEVGEIFDTVDLERHQIVAGVGFRF
ncbi:outer membrane protein [Qipengyuania nanhaisediminis]|uniref:Outer membrane immunogenic protein n=1 Tax=Qipengyuania nanhaisediminis TaxID=604088 RepID=A0A1I5QEQ5_9SPHN|nr:porin family protein [Qipengyuania nanhaisediminis]SFP44745.1 outer membrane immunogenic protein [Qipengyuania nanhaisediminis]